jgi:hypothetical protein
VPSKRAAAKARLRLRICSIPPWPRLGRRAHD